MSTTTNKTAVLIFSDPGGGDEALGRVYNALAAAYDFDLGGERPSGSSSRAPAPVGPSSSHRRCTPPTRCTRQCATPSSVRPAGAPTCSGRPRACRPAAST